LKQTVETDKTLLVEGPASVKVISGKAEVFGYQLKEERRTVIREGKRLPFFVREKAELEVSLGANASIQEVAGNTVPSSWAQPVQALLNLEKKPAVIMVLGKIDSGKSSFCTYLTNKLVSAKCKVAVLDGDSGQSDVGPPCTVAYTIASKPVTELYELKMGNAFFVGVTSPVQAIGKTIEGLVLMKKEIMEKSPDFIIINTDGWVAGDFAVNYKLQLIGELKPDIIVFVQVKDELKELLSSIENTSTITLQASYYVGERTAEKRKKIRELNYAKFLKDAKVRSFILSYLKVEGKNALPKEPGKEKGFLLALENQRRKFLGIGVLLEINRTRKSMSVLTRVKAKPAIIEFGKVRLDDNLREI
jgi:polynucleotide 5'-hydroxyl-kinase GRC3/NOL9